MVAGCARAIYVALRRIIQRCDHCNLCQRFDRTRQGRHGDYKRLRLRPARSGAVSRHPGLKAISEEAETIRKARGASSVLPTSSSSTASEFNTS